LFEQFKKESRTNDLVQYLEMVAVSFVSILLILVGLPRLTEKILRDTSHVPNRVQKKLLRRTQEDPILAWRMWQIQNGELDSLGRSTSWAPGNNVAKHQPESERCFASQLGMESCSCGYYAWDSKKQALQMYTTSECLVLGLIQLWGTVVKYEKGYRATNAKILALSDRKNLMKEWGYPEDYRKEVFSKIHKIGKKYGVPVLSDKALEIFYKEMGGE
jgi:hypothetical protein